MSKKTYILGFCAYWTEGHATLICDGEVLVSFSENRFTNVKHDSTFPVNSIKACLKSAGIELHELNAVVFNQKPFLKFEAAMKEIFINTPFSYIAFMNASAEWITLGRLFLKNDIVLGLNSIASGSPLPELLFADHNMLQKFPLINILRSDCASALLAWHIHFKKPLVLDVDKIRGELKEFKNFEVNEKYSLKYLPVSDTVTTRDLRFFGIIMGLIILILFSGLVPYLNKSGANNFFLASGLLLFTLGLFLPQSLAKVHDVWIFLAKIIGKVKGIIFYTFLYYIIIIPYAFFLKIFFPGSLKINDFTIEDYDMRGPF